MSTRTKPKAKPMEPIGHLTFESINAMAKLTNAEHIAILENELPSMRLAVAALNMNDREMTDHFREADEETLDSALDLVESLGDIQKRHEAAVGICQSAAARILIVLSRIDEAAAAT